MDGDELARIEATLLAAIAEGKVVVTPFGVGDQFRQIVRQAREMHDLSLDALCAGGFQATQRMRGLCTALGNAVNELEIIDFLVKFQKKLSSMVFHPLEHIDRNFTSKILGKHDAYP